MCENVSIQKKRYENSVYGGFRSGLYFDNAYLKRLL